MRPSSTLAILLGLVCAFATETRASLILGTYEFTGTGTSGDASVPTSSDVTFTSFARSSGLSAVSDDDVFNSSGFDTVPANDPPNTSEYTSFTVSTVSNPVILENLTYDSAGDGGAWANGINIQAELFINSVSHEVSPIFDLPFNSGDSDSYNFDFADVQIGAGDTAEFRFYANSHRDPGRNVLDNVALTGSVIPEPGTFSVLLLGGLALAAMRRRRR